MKLWLVNLWERLIGTNPYGLKPHTHNDKLITFEGKLKDGKSFYFVARQGVINFDVFEGNHKKWKSQTPFDRRLEYKTKRINKVQAIRICTFWITEYYENI